MKKKFVLSALVPLLAFIGCLETTDGALAAEKVRWKLHSGYGKNLAVVGIPPHRIADAVRAMSGGDFDINVFEPGALAGGFAYYDPVSQGAIDAAFGTPAANQGKNPAYALLSSWPFGPATPEFMAWMLYGGGAEIAEEFYARDNIKYHFCGMNALKAQVGSEKRSNRLRTSRG